MTCNCSDRQAIIAVLNRYATCLDSRDWHGLDEVFYPDATAQYGRPVNGRAEIIESIEQDYEDHVFLAVVLDDDPGRDLGLLRQPGHRFYFTPEEVEPLALGEQRREM